MIGKIAACAAATLLLACVGSAACARANEITLGHDNFKLSGRVPTRAAWHWAGDEYRLYAYRPPAGGPASFLLDSGGALDSDLGVAMFPDPGAGLTLAPEWWQNWTVGALELVSIICAAALFWWWHTSTLLRQRQQLDHAVLRRTRELEQEKNDLLRTSEQMRHFAEHDGLTGLWNHRIIVERLRAEVSRAQREDTPVSIILADLDFFKNVNDTFGHPFGDIVLRSVADVFSRSVRTYDWVGRFGGEEFLLILPGTGLQSARARAEELRHAVQALHIVEGSAAVCVTVSLGVASGFAGDDETLLRAADAALYRAKSGGRNCVVATEVESGKAPQGTA